MSETEFWDFQYDTVMRENAAIERGELTTEESEPARIRALLAGASGAAGSRDRPEEDETVTHEESMDG